MEIRNPTKIDDTLIDVEINHPTFGWIPFAASKDDYEPHGREIYRIAREMLEGDK